MMEDDGTRKAPTVKRWFLRRPEYRLHCTPTSGSWLYQVERCIAEITEKRVRLGAIQSGAALEQAIKEFLEDHNRNPRPFVWTAVADPNLGRAKAIRQRPSGSER